MTRVFIHCAAVLPYARQIAATIAGVECNAERALVLAQQGDVVCVAGSVDREYLDFLGSLGLGPDPADVLVVPVTSARDELRPLCRCVLDATETMDWLRHRLRASDHVELHPFIASSSHFDLAAALRASGVAARVIGGNPYLVGRADRKDAMRAKALELGLPVADGEVVALPYAGGRRRRDLAPLSDAIARYLDRTGRVLVRGAHGASGSCAFVVGDGWGDVTSVLHEMARRGDNQTYLVEVMVEATASPNVQMHVAPDGGPITCVGVTDQRWSRPLVHAGNAFPCVAETADEMVRWSSGFTEWLQREGYVGPVGFDFVEYREPATGEPRVLFAEVNPRVNGATFPLALRERLRPAGAAFVSGVVETGARSFAELRAVAGHLFYRPETGTGAVPYLTALLPQGKYLVAVFATSAVEAVETLTDLRQVGAAVMTT